MKKRFAAAALIAVFLLSGCSGADADDNVIVNAGGYEGITASDESAPSSALSIPSDISQNADITENTVTTENADKEETSAVAAESSPDGIGIRFRKRFPNRSRFLLFRK